MDAHVPQCAEVDRVTSNELRSEAGLPRAAAIPWLPLVLVLNALVWTLAAWLSRGNLDRAGDMVENYVWGIEWQAGYKHPPLFAWITAAWFSVMPRTDWAYFALSALNAGVGLLGVAALARRFLSSEGAAFAALALAVSPFYTVMAIKFNANAVLLSLWPWAAACFVAFMQDGRRRDAAACGALAALALLGKYFSVVLVMGLALAALVIPNWRQRLRGGGLWLALAAGLVVLMPHLLWLFFNEFSTLRFASQRGAGSLGPALQRLANYAIAQAGYLLPSAIFLLWAVPASRRREAASLLVRAIARPSLHRELWWLALAPMLVVAAIAALAGTQMASVWGMAQWFAVTALWVAVLGQRGIVPRVHWLRGALPVVWLAVLAIAPAVGIYEARRGSATAIEPRAELAQAAHALWTERTGRPLPAVGGSFVEALSIAFYAPGKTRWGNPAESAATPWISPSDWRREGGLLVCAGGDEDCHRWARAESAAPPIEVSVHKESWGMTLPVHTYSLYLVLPE